MYLTNENHKNHHKSTGGVPMWYWTWTPSGLWSCTSCYRGRKERFGEKRNNRWLLLLLVYFWKLNWDMSRVPFIHFGFIVRFTWLPGMRALVRVTRGNGHGWHIMQGVIWWHGGKFSGIVVLSVGQWREFYRNGIDRRQKKKGVNWNVLLW